MRNDRTENLTLIADDDLFIHKVLKEILKSFTQFDEVIDGANVLAKYKEILPDIVFLDIHMPNVDGLQLIKDIKEFDPEAYIVMVTADSKLENVQSAIKDGAAGFIVKPFDKQTVIKSFGRCPAIIETVNIPA